MDLEVSFMGRDLSGATCRHAILISSLKDLSPLVVLSDECVIVSDPDVCGGKPVARGTRVPVQYILELSTKGYSVDKIHEEYPTVSVDLIAKVLKLLSESRIRKAHEDAGAG